MSRFTLFFADEWDSNLCGGPPRRRDALKYLEYVLPEYRTLDTYNEEITRHLWRRAQIVMQKYPKFLSTEKRKKYIYIS